MLLRDIIGINGSQKPFFEPFAIPPARFHASAQIQTYRFANEE